MWIEVDGVLINTSNIATINLIPIYSNYGYSLKGYVQAETISGNIITLLTSEVQEELERKYNSLKLALTSKGSMYALQEESP